ncbi:bifunctional folylpolyglutamate synthase/dihydrofolate synthase [Brevundimonas aveniformis]|uniref:bifunctional folylpolyglutamate synthase/dihydrofolate synthase n=1 Tax=Brevundimonas aveniformis TaxID=370977 RepID=UPI00040C78D5|nr:folylpolyglutamate synthase/dihydrofolate synthase family protein [Brevundimonas aveniformis]
MDPISARLLARHPQKIDLSLDRIQRLLAAVGNPQDQLPPVVHVAGTNGKGSTVAFLRAMAEADGRVVSVYTSPHLVRFNERIRLAGRLIEDIEFERILDQLDVVDADVRATVFEMTTAAAFLAMAAVPADLAIVEVGLGGVLDATNVIDHPRLSVITPVDLDHAEFLGTDLTGIAREKAGILKPGRPAVIARQQALALEAIETRAGELGAPLSVLGRDFDAWAERGRLTWQGEDRLLDLPLPALVGPHQIDNAGLAVAAALQIGLSVEAIGEGLRTARWPARMQPLTAGPYADEARIAGAELWLDGGHNPHAARALADALTQLDLKAPRPLALIAGMLANKDARGFFEAFSLFGAPVFTVPFEGACRPPEDLAEAARQAGLRAQAMPDVTTALRAALSEGAGRVLICGSLYLAGEVLGASPDTWPT